jgi:hypothetical protein
MTEKDTSSLEALNEIRDMMKKSSRFISLSGLSGVSAGVFALIGALAAYVKMSFSWEVPAEYGYESKGVSRHYFEINDFIVFCLYDAVFVIGGALIFAFFFTYRKSRKMGQSIWDETARRMIISLMIPLCTGGVFCLALLYHQVYGLIAPAMLVFYGLSLLNGAKYTVHDIHILGYTEIVLGMVCAFLPGYGLLFWAVGFGIFHVIYGIFMYWKYERK